MLYLQIIVVRFIPMVLFLIFKLFTHSQAKVLQRNTQLYTHLREILQKFSEILQI